MSTRGAWLRPRPATNVTARPSASASSGVIGWMFATPRMPSVPNRDRVAGRDWVTAAPSFGRGFSRGPARGPQGLNGDVGGARLDQLELRLIRRQLHRERQARGQGAPGDA